MIIHDSIAPSIHLHAYHRAVQPRLISINDDGSECNAWVGQRKELMLKSPITAEPRTIRQ